MTFGAASPRPAACRCLCHDPGPRRERLKAAAVEYASTLNDGSEIHVDIDYPRVAPFWPYLFEALKETGFAVSVRVADGTTIYTVRKQPTQETT